MFCVLGLKVTGQKCKVIKDLSNISSNLGGRRCRIDEEMWLRFFSDLKMFIFVVFSFMSFSYSSRSRCHIEKW